jgi:glucose-6-phosphate 1-dehydrogenase
MDTMKTDIHQRSVLFLLFGAGGDLSCRLILPALYNLHLDHQLPERFFLLGIDRNAGDSAALRERYRQAIGNYSRRGRPNDVDWRGFAERIRYVDVDLSDAGNYEQLADLLAKHEREWKTQAEHVFYLALPPSMFVTVAEGLGNAGLAKERHRVRVVVEKPLGHDLESFYEINEVLTRFFTERQIFRIDHFLGKETVQNILAMRFANPIFEPIWNRRYVDHVAITVAETLGVEHRGRFYEQAGAMRDMVQNHLLQLLSLVAMEPPVAYDADDIRGRKMDVLRALRSIPQDAVQEFAARGQYDSGWIKGEHVPAYREEPDVDPLSNIETYAALKLYVDNWRWQDVPFYLRTGKRMAMDVSEISIRFRDVPHRAFPASVGLNTQPTRLVVQIQPEQGIVLKFMAKEPGSTLQLRPVDMRFSYKEAFERSTPDAYETLLWDVMVGDATLFMRADQAETAWRLVTPVLELWAENAAPDFPNYAAGSWGPESAEALVARDGKNWLTPTAPHAARKRLEVSRKRYPPMRKQHYLSRRRS